MSGAGATDPTIGSGSSSGDGGGGAGLPATLGPYTIIKELGRGGMGLVLHARRDDLKRDFALKVILTGADASPEAVRRFKLEAQAAAQLSDHPGIATVHDIGEVGSKVYFAMDLVAGGSLETLIEVGELTPQQGAAIVEEAARAVHYAHNRGILHRDLKPGNILITTDGSAKVTDFGLAKSQDAGPDVTRLTQSGQVLGTPAYMPPEQAGAKALDARADVYSLGATLYEVLTGAPPFTGDSLYSVLAKVMRETPRPVRKCNPAVPADLAVITEKCLAKEPERRYATAAELADDLERFRTSKPITAKPPSVGYLMQRAVRRHPVVTALGAVIALLLLGGGLFLVPQLLEASRARAASEAREQRSAAYRAAFDAAMPKVHDFLLAVARGSQKKAAKGREAIAALDAALAVPGEAKPIAWVWMGRCKRALSEDASDCWERALGIEPGHGLALYERGADAMVRYRRTRPREGWMSLPGTGAIVIMPPETGTERQLRETAQRDLEAARAAGVEAYLIAMFDAEAALHQSQFETAERLASEFLHEVDWLAEPFFIRARARFGLERFEEALADCERALFIDDTHVGALSEKASLLYQTGKSREAL
ncbi:MAG: protein kinase domain-containing protein, partial [Planctomycetota bacterium]